MCCLFFTNRLPEVPPLWEVACIFADLPAGVDKALCDGIRDYGRVMSRAPVQITEINERPGGLSIKWHEVHNSFSRLEICTELQCNY